MSLTAANIYQSILLRAADEWGVQYEDIERDIGQQFDPVVRFLAGACASELELVYQRINDTEYRLQQRLAKTLLPEYYHLPTPAHALATANPVSDHVQLDEMSSFMYAAGEEKGEIAFSPMLPLRLLGGELLVLATPQGIIDERQRAPLTRKSTHKAERLGKVLIGIRLKAETEAADWRNTSLYFDLRGRSEVESEKARFFAALSKSKCMVNGREIALKSGFPDSEFLLEDYLNGNERLQRVLRARYERHFLTFLDFDVPVAAVSSASEFLPPWFAAHQLEEQEVQTQMSKLERETAGQPLLWVELTLRQPVDILNMLSRLVVRLNVFPVINRRLCGNSSGEHYFLQNNALKWIHLQPSESFLSIRRVYEEKSPSYQTFTFKPFADFKEEGKPSYTLRMGGIGRWDELNAWKRMAYLLSLLQENYAHQEVVQKAAASLSLEEIHRLLGRKVAETETEQKPDKDIYILLHIGSNANMRVRVEYWTSIGSDANGIPAKAKLSCRGKASGDIESVGAELITATEGGAMPLDTTGQLDAMKATLLSRGRIVTREDVKVFCKEQFRDRLANVTVSDGVGTDPRYDFGMTRRLEVRIIPSPSAQNEDWESNCYQLQCLLEEMSASNVPIFVALETGESS